MRPLFLLLFPLVLVGLVLGVSIARRAPADEAPDAQLLKIEIPEGYSYGGGSFGRHLDISTDGKSIVYVGSPNGESSRLYLQGIGESKPSEIAGTEGANDPSFSTDGRAVAFWANGNLSIVDLAKGSVAVIGQTLAPRGIAWLDANTLILGNTQGELLKLPVSGGVPSPLIPEMGPHLPQLSPQVLPGNKAVLYTLANGPLISARIGVLSIATGEKRELFEENGFSPCYASSGHIVFAQGFERKLMAARFNLDKLEIAGPAQAVLDTPLAGRGTGGSTDYASGTNGTLVYMPRTEPSVDNVLEHIGDIDLDKPIHVKANWFEQLKEIVP